MTVQLLKAPRAIQIGFARRGNFLRPAKYPNRGVLASILA